MESRVSQAQSRTVVVLAAGEGKRMKSATPKMLHPLLGRTLLGHVLHAATAAAASRTVVVVGHKADQVRAHLTEIAPGATPVLQAEQNGTGHAVRIALDAIPEATGTVVVLNADVPLLRPETVEALVAAHESTSRGATVLAAEVPDPAGLGRIVRDGAGNLERIVEERDASPRSGRSARSTPASTPSTPRCCARRSASSRPTTTRVRST
nr:hypothetical protein GCM10020092_010410 [Actinoplanes digitatis]